MRVALTLLLLLGVVSVSGQRVYSDDLGPVESDDGLSFLLLFVAILAFIIFVLKSVFSKGGNEKRTLPNEGSSSSIRSAGSFISGSDLAKHILGKFLGSGKCEVIFTLNTGKGKFYVLKPSDPNITNNRPIWTRNKEDYSKGDTVKLRLDKISFKCGKLNDFLRSDEKGSFGDKLKNMDIYFVEPLFGSKTAFEKVCK
ncbi:MAG: hypothetical protein EOP48_07670 [Sphingobacteriales bacterium]|nr:MAG: hypothetical protein EOP48_07670 [Sphingobacteriales bacterium]